MNTDFKYLLDGSFHAGSKVWVYQSNRIFSLGEALEVEDMLNEFTAQWKSHGAPVKGAGYLFFGQFIILMADERATGVGGCSTDSSVRLIKEVEQRFAVNMFDRTSLAFIIKDKVQLLPMSQFAYAFTNEYLDGNTLYFNNLVHTKEELETQWIVPIKDSWLAKKTGVKA